MTSAVTATPSALASRTAASASAEDRCSRCRRAPVRRARARSRRTMISSDTAGRPGRPRRLDSSPSFIQPAPAKEGSSQWSAMTTPRPEAYSRALRMTEASWTPLPSSVKIRTPSAAISAIGASSLPSRADRYGPGRADVAAGALGQVEDLADDRGRVRRGLGIGHRHDRRVTAERGGTSAGLDRLGFFGPGLAQMGVQVDQAGRDDAAARVEHDGARPAAAQPRLDGSHDLTFHQHVGAPAPGGVDHRAAPQQYLPFTRQPGPPIRVVGRARPCARLRRWPPGR